MYVFLDILFCIWNLIGFKMDYNLLIMMGKFSLKNLEYVYVMILYNNVLFFFLFFVYLKLINVYYMVCVWSW